MRRECGMSFMSCLKLYRLIEMYQSRLPAMCYIEIQLVNRCVQVPGVALTILQRSGSVV